MICIKRIKCIAFLALVCIHTQAQETATVNGVADVRSGSIAFTNATVVKDAQTTLTNATLLIRNGKIVSVSTNAIIPADAVTINCTGKYIYPSFIDLYTDYGISSPQRAGRGFDFYAPVQFNSNTKGAYGWNQAIKPETNAAASFVVDDSKAKGLRDIGFGVVLTHIKDGIARGTGAVVDLSNRKENFVLLKEKAASFYSFNKGTSTQSYPSSMMGSIAILRQSFLDAQWYKNNPAISTEGTNLSLQAWNNNLALPQIFEAGDKWNDLRADRIGDEFAVQFIVKAGQNEYERIPEIKGTKASFILPLNFPVAIDVEDPSDVRFVSLATLKQWEMAPSNPAAFEKAEINFCLTTADLKEGKQFFPNLRKAIQYGLSEKAALDALTKNPAQLIGMYNHIGSIDAGKQANFIITNGNIFTEKTVILQNWIQGEKNIIKEDNGIDTRGKYLLTISNNGADKNFIIDVKDNSTAEVIIKNDTLSAKYSNNGKQVKINFAEAKKIKKGYVLTGIYNEGREWNGTGIDSAGNMVTWVALFNASLPLVKDSVKKEKITNITMGTLTYPNMAYGFKQLPTKETILIKNATVWTNEAEGILTNTDVLIENGKIISVGKNLSSNTAKIIDGTGKHVTAGIIDEHSHIAAASINEGGQSVTSEVRIGDNLDPDDVDIYRQLSGGVTTSHILHGSANTIGGQTQLIKLRWGVNDTALKFVGADGFIKFALGENVKRNPAPENNRFPDTRMGVEQVQTDAFTRAQDYVKAIKGTDAKKVRRDLELDALVEIMEKKRFITCHSYVASEILQTMEMAEKFGFKINTFTHILEGYKVADKMKAHGVAASTFSDWWAYKVEVQDAIPYNATIMHNIGLNVAINSDDAEMARRLNQEAAKSVKYGGMSEEDALKMVTINPAKMLHIDNKVGSIKKGKDADIVLWSDNPLSTYAKAEKTIVDGIIYFDRERDLQIRKEIFAERTRIIQKLMDEKNAGNTTAPAKATLKRNNTCGSSEHEHGLLDE
jgi:imidazolonepropionase-like amidohydrolase